jgi:fructokinase
VTRLEPHPPGDDGSRKGVVEIVGEALIDLVPAGGADLFQAVPGGSPANVAVGLARLGVHARMLARLADDAFGRRLRLHLEQNGVDLAQIVAASEPSSLAVVSLDVNGGASYDFRVAGTADWQWSDSELGGAVSDDVVALHAGSLAMTTLPGAAVLGRLLERARSTATVSYDPNCRPLLMGTPEQVRTAIERCVTCADIVKVSAEDLAWLVPNEPIEDVAAGWLGRGPALVIVTLGPDGAFALGRVCGVVREEGVPVRVVDTVGAGDSFTSALLAGLHRRDLLGADRRPTLHQLDEYVLSEVLGEAIVASALTCTRRGAEPPTWQEVGNLATRAEAAPLHEAR